MQTDRIRHGIEGGTTGGHGTKGTQGMADKVKMMKNLSSINVTKVKRSECLKVSECLVMMTMYREATLFRRGNSYQTTKELKTNYSQTRRDSHVR
jgi:hypothetical protein